MPQTWIFDAHLLDQGWNQPRCQQVCPTDVFEAVKLDDAAMKKKAATEGLKVLKPDLGTKPRVWYRGWNAGRPASSAAASAPSSPGRWNASRARR